MCPAQRCLEESHVLFHSICGPVLFPISSSVLSLWLKFKRQGWKLYASFTKFYMLCCDSWECWIYVLKILIFMNVSEDSFFSPRISSSQSKIQWTNRSLLTPNNNRCFWNLTAWICYLVSVYYFLSVMNASKGVLLYLKTISYELKSRVTCSFSRIHDM